MRWPNAYAVVAAILAVGVAGSLIVLAVGASLYETVSAQGSTLLASTLGAAIGAIAGYIGGARWRDRNDDE